MIDLTIAIEPGMRTFPTHPPVEAESNIAQDTKAVTHQVTFSTHTGTHVDAPAHFVDGGSTTDEYPPDFLSGLFSVADLRDYIGEAITPKILKNYLPDKFSGGRVLLITGDVDWRFGDQDFFDEAAVLTPDAAEWLVSKNVSVVANDFLTEGIDNPDRPVHHTLLGDGVPIIEYLSNTETLVEEDTVRLCCCPLHLSGLEAAPARVIAYPESL